MSEAAILTAKELKRDFVHATERVTVLSGIDLSLKRGERVALVGPSGSGKSTLLSVLGALDADYQGSVRIHDVELRELTDARRAELRNRTLGFVFQAYNLLAHLTVLENVLLPARFRAGRLDLTRAKEVIHSVGLADKLSRKPATLSGGERQRVAIARALFHQPELVLCDEPTGNLDAETGAEILALFDRLSTSGVALLIATHDDAIAERAHRTLRLHHGRLA